MLHFRDDDHAFSKFINEYQEQVFHIVLNMVQHTEDAEEITQDVFVDVFRKPDAFRGEAQVSTWLYRIAVNKSIDHLRKKQRRNRWMGIWPVKEQTPEPPDFIHPGIIAENREKSVYLFRAMKQLPPNQHAAWTLSEIENLSYKDIAEVLNLSLSSVESLIFRARQNLRKILSGMHPGNKQITE